MPVPKTAERIQLDHIFEMCSEEFNKLQVLVLSILQEAQVSRVISKQLWKCPNWMQSPTLALISLTSKFQRTSVSSHLHTPLPREPRLSPRTGSTRSLHRRGFCSHTLESCSPLPFQNILSYLNTVALQLTLPDYSTTDCTLLTASRPLTVGCLQLSTLAVSIFSAIPCLECRSIRPCLLAKKATHDLHVAESLSFLFHCSL